MTMTATHRPPRGPVTFFGQVVRGISRVCGVLSATMIVASVIITCQLIFVRFVLNQSTIWQTEAVTYLMIGATLIGLPYVQLLRGHVNVELVPLLLAPRYRRILIGITTLLTLLIALLMLFYGYELFSFAWQRNWRSDTVWGVKLWIPYIALPVGFALYSLQLLADIVSPAPPPLEEPTLTGVVDPVAPERPDAGEKAALSRPASE
ncbi:C4-dicarboxylate ABC transporter substrate-binding protein [Acuticoccus sediminis]|uniref:TRAP transporter small permease protein n=1 Tax=Acuticoccus sediminis TaxID=2184697 RepID=A0A8B2NT18_9HYPH|nr:C4-dicarboxylate ABC transporter substrate-binding protein [Acuticoccus sediminis]